MSTAAFDGSTYRRTVLTPLRTATPSSVDDLFWLGHVPRDVDDDAQIAAHLKSTKAFLNKEKSRPRQADVAAAVLREWPRVEGVLGDAAARASLRARLGEAAPGAEVAGASGVVAAGGVSDGAAPGSGAGLDPAARRRRQVASALGELARLRDEPELAEDLFAFLGLPVTATAEMLRGRVEKVVEVNRKRRPDRERSLVDELLMHCRELLVDGDPADYRAALAADAAGPVAGPAAPPVPTPSAEAAGEPEPSAAPREPAAAPGSAATPLTATVNAAPGVEALRVAREADGAVRLTWDWPVGVTEVFVVVGDAGDPDTAGSPSRKVTNTKYEIDGGARFADVPAGATLTVFSGRRDQAGRLAWLTTPQPPATIAP